MHVIAGDDEVEHAQTMTYARLVEPFRPQPPIADKPEQELTTVAAMREVPNMTG
jgi:hypothetical protein